MKFFKNNDYYLLINWQLEIINFSKNVSLIWETLYLKKIRKKQSLIKYLPKDLLVEFIDLLKVCLKSESIIFEKTITFPNEKALNLHITLNPIVFSEDLNCILICIKNNRGNRTLINQTKALSRYAYLTSHKLRAPLSNILSLSNSIQETKDFDYDPGVIKKLLEDISQQAESLDSIIYTLNNLITKENNDNLVSRELSIQKVNTVILIDDEPFVNRIHQKLLTTHWQKIVVRTFTDASQALAALLKDPPELIMLDINMPTFNGWQFLNALQKAKISIDVVMVSSSIDPEEKRKAFTYENVKYFLNKPLTYDQLTQVLKSPDSLYQLN